MNENNNTSLQRVLTTLNHQEPDQVPLFLLLTMHGAKELDVSIPEYFSKAENIVKGQLLMREKFKNDCLYNIFHAAIEIEAMGGEVIFRSDGPANSGTPIIKKTEDIKNLEMPIVSENPCLQKVLDATAGLKDQIDDAPIIGAVMSPFSLPVIQMGFENYFNLIYEQPKLFNHLMELNESFCVEWSNAQLEAGATAVGYFDPVSSTTIIPRELYLKTGFPVAKRTIAKIKGPTATHMASGRCLSIVDDIAQTGTLALGFSVLEDIAEMKKACKNKLALLGNLNGIEMCRWTPKIAESKVKELIAKAGLGGGFILSDNHGEIPWQVPEKILLSISEAVHKWGQYPLDWVIKYGK